MSSLFFTNPEDPQYKEYQRQKEQQRRECASRGHDPRTVTYCGHCGEPLPTSITAAAEEELKEAEEVKALIREVEHDTALHILTILGSALADVKRQYRIPEDAVRDIYHIMKEDAIRKGWVD